MMGSNLRLRAGLAADLKSFFRLFTLKMHLSMSRYFPTFYHGTSFLCSLFCPMVATVPTVELVLELIFGLKRKASAGGMQTRAAGNRNSEKENHLII